MVQPIIIVAGPTAVGKSILAVKISKALKGEVINLDSVQLYKDFIIGAAQPTLQEMQEVPHHLYGVVSPLEKIGVGKFLKLYTPVLEELESRSVVPVFCGGTSLYVNGVIYGLSDLPEDQNVRDEIDRLSTEDIYKALVLEDPASAARLHMHDRIRIARALEVRRLGFSIIEGHAIHQKKEPRPTIIIVPMMARDRLYDRINQRTSNMLAAGLLDEAKSLYEQYGQNAPGLSSIGYEQALEYLTTKKYHSEQELVAAIAQATRRFAKRQMTWLRNEPRKKSWRVRPDGGDSIELLTREKIGAKHKTGEDFAAWACTFDQLAEELYDHISALRTEKSSVQLWFVTAEKMV